MIIYKYFDIIRPTGDFMAKQMIASCNPLYGFKYTAQEQYPECSIFEHDVNQTIDLGCGEANGHFVREKIITDGKISLHKKNPYSPKVIWQNVLVTLENGVSISVDISDATFMIDIIKFGDKRKNEIHVVKEDKDSLQTILNYLYHRQPITNLSSVSFKAPSVLVLETAAKGETKSETFDFGTGKTIKKRKKH